MLKTFCSSCCVKTGQGASVMSKVHVDTCDQLPEKPQTLLVPMHLFSACVTAVHLMTPEYISAFYLASIRNE